MKIYVMKILKYIKICMLLNRTGIFEIVQELDVASFYLKFKIVTFILFILKILIVRVRVRYSFFQNEQNDQIES